MSDQQPVHDDIPRVYYMGTINVHVIGGGGQAPQLAIETRRSDREKDDAIWSIIADLKPCEHAKLDRLIANAIAQFREAEALSVPSIP